MAIIVNREIYLLIKRKLEFPNAFFNVNGHVCLFVRIHVVNILAPTKYPY